MDDNLAVLVPLKSFALGKSRLRQSGHHGVAELSRRLATGVLSASYPRPVFVVCESDDVEIFARELGATALRVPPEGLNAAVTSAVDRLSPDFPRIMVVHGDLRSPDGLGSFDPPEGVTIVTDISTTGTNVLVIPTDVGFEFAFGPNSAHAHRREALRLELAVNVITSSPWCSDVDVIDDLAP